MNVEFVKPREPEDIVVVVDLERLGDRMTATEARD